MCNTFVKNLKILSLYIFLTAISKLFEQVFPVVAFAIQLRYDMAVMPQRSKYRKNKPKRHIRPSILYFLIICAIAISYIFIVKPFDKPDEDKWAGYESANDNAESISRVSCLVFYPSGYENHEDLLNTLCIGAEGETVDVHDYTLTKDLDYQYLAYDGKIISILDQSMKVPSLPAELNETALRKVSDYLRYTMKASGREEAYSLEFLEQSYFKNLKALEMTYALEGDFLSVYCKPYEQKVLIPLKYIGEDIGIAVTQEKYQRPHYVDPYRKAVALTFDDGPSYDNSTRGIIDELYKYDGCGTFFLLGGRINDHTAPVIRDGIAYGNQYGSHTMGHADLTKLDPASIQREVNGVGDILKNTFEYEMKIYRPPYGKYNGTVDSALSFPAIMWEIDTKDWSLKEGQKIADVVVNSVSDRKILLFHDIYDATKQSLVDKKAIQTLVSQGYQLVTIDELAELRNVQLVQSTHFGW